MKKILVTGGNGQLAQAMQHHPLHSECKPIFLSRDACDITNETSIENAITLHQPHVIVNTAAYTAVDLAETERDAAMQVNALGPRLLAAACKKHEIRLIHLSTDYVFDGASSQAYTEDHPTHPINVYGESKLAGEMAIRDGLNQHVILRVSGVFSEFGRNFLKTILRLAREKEYLSVVNDQITCPTDAYAIAGAIYTIANNEAHHGTYHYCSEPPVSWFQFAACILGGTCQYHIPLKTHTMKKIATADYKTAAKRPAYSVLASERITRDFGIPQPHWQAGIDRVLAILLKETA